MKDLKTPLTNKDIKNLKIYDKVTITGTIYTGRDTILPKLVKKIKNNEKIPLNLKGTAILHTAVSDAGIAPTSSNKIEIESSITPLSKEGIKLHIGKGKITKETIKELKKENSAFLITPPVAALLTDKIKVKKQLMFEEEGIEALYQLKVEKFPAIVAAVNGKSIF